MNISIPQPAKTWTIPVGYTFISTDDNSKQTVYITVNCGAGQPPFQFLLWSGSAYVSAGDYTQSALTAAVADYLSSLSA